LRIISVCRTAIYFDSLHKVEEKPKKDDKKGGKKEAEPAPAAPSGPYKKPKQFVRFVLC